LSVEIEITQHLLDLTFEAAVKSYWRRKKFRRFLQKCGLSDRFLATWHEDQSKRDFLDTVFDSLPASEEGRLVICKMVLALCDQTTFPDLRGWPDSDQKITEAARAVEVLKAYCRQKEAVRKGKRKTAEARKEAAEMQAASRRTERNLAKLENRLNDLSGQLGTQKAGYDFQDWFYDLLDHFEIANRRPYVDKGRQIDGSLTLFDTTYLVELKFTTDQAGAPDVDSILKKISDKADNTMGVMVSISGYSSVALREASGPKTPLLLLDHNHIYSVLRGVWKFSELIDRVRRHASQTGDAYLGLDDF